MLLTQRCLRDSAVFWHPTRTFLPGAVFFCHIPAGKFFFVFCVIVLIYARILNIMLWSLHRLTRVYMRWSAVKKYLQNFSSCLGNGFRKVEDCVAIYKFVFRYIVLFVCVLGGGGDGHPSLPCHCLKWRSDRPVRFSCLRCIMSCSKLMTSFVSSWRRAQRHNRAFPPQNCLVCRIH